MTAEIDAASWNAALDEIEQRIRDQASVAPVGSMEWRAHIADLAHVEATRVVPPTSTEGR